jgi:predicted DNA-binding protein (UPF0278 family)
MKLFLNKNQKNYILEILRASENNAINGKDFELARAFSDLYKQIEPDNQAYVNLNRNESEIIVEFCEIVRQSLDKAISFLDKDTERDPDEVANLKEDAVKARDEINEITNQLQEKIRQNP